MVTSRSPGSNPRPRPDLRDRFYHDRYEWCIYFRCTDAFCLKPAGQDLDSYQAKVRQRWHYRNAARLRGRGHRAVHNHGGSWHVSNTGADVRQLERLLQLASMIWQNPAIKSVFYHDWIYLYTSDLGHALQQLAQADLVTQPTVRQAVINRERGTILRRDPEHELRSYFRERRVTLEQKQTLAKFLSSQDDVVLSPSLASWTQNSNLWLRSYFYIDHVAQSSRLMIEIITPGMLGRCVRIVAINTA